MKKLKNKEGKILIKLIAPISITDLANQQAKAQQNTPPPTAVDLARKAEQGAGPANEEPQAPPSEAPQVEENRSPSAEDSLPPSLPEEGENPGDIAQIEEGNTRSWNSLLLPLRYHQVLKRSLLKKKL